MIGSCGVVKFKNLLVVAGSFVFLVVYCGVSWMFFL